jgi:hypothetical protein
MFMIAFENLKSNFNTQKVCLKKKSVRLVKKIKVLIRVKKWPKNTFDKNLKIKLLPKSSF